MNLDRFLLDKNNAALLIIDIQERLAAVMDRKDQVIANVLHLVELARLQNMPILVTEQYPKGLGRTVSEITSALPAHVLVEKVAFNCCGEPSFNEHIHSIGRKKLIVTGMETHICVLQTCLGLLQKGYDVHVAADAVCSRAKSNWRSGIDIIRDAGGVATNTETVLFQLLGVAGTDAFKKISQRIK